MVMARELWASATSALNDTSEMQYGRLLIAEVWQSMRASARFPLAMRAVDRIVVRMALDDAPAFLLSASAQSDSLNQWMHYSGTAGYAIGFSADVFLSPVVDGAAWEKHTATYSLARMATWHDVVYDRHRQIQMAASLLSAILDEIDNVVAPREEFAAMLNGLAARFKHFAFADEREVRLITWPSPGAETRFRSGRHGIIPYLRVGAGFPALDRKPLPPLPIAHVMCAPTEVSRAPAAERDLRRLLEANGLDHVRTSVSRIPYRA